jgi:HlyD family secretion protein
MNRTILLLSFLALAACNGNQYREVQTTLASRGTFSEELTEEGTLRAVNSIVITAPRISYRYGGLKIANLVEDGTEVQQGDTVVVFDPSEIKKGIIDLEQRLEIARAEYDKLIATQESEIEDLEADLEIARISLEISKINLEQSEHEAEVTKKEIQLKLDNAEIALVRAGEQIENKKKIHQEDAFQKSLNIKQIEAQLEDANNSLNSLFVVSPAPGIAIIERNWMTGMKWQVSDQPYSGTKMIELPDLNEMMAEVEINEVDISKIKPGLEVVVTPDAYSDTTFPGEITEVANLARNKDWDSKIKVFPVTVSLKGRAENLMPGLTVSCRILVNQISDVVYVPLESVFKKDGEEYVYVKTASGFQRRPVRVGAMNTDYALISEGLSENEEIALSDPFLNKEEAADADIMANK